MAATQIIETHHEETISVYGLAGADTFVPPTRFFVLRPVKAGRMMVAAECVTNQNSIRVLFIERAVGFVHQFITGQFSATYELQWLVKACSLRRDDAYRVFMLWYVHTNHL